MRLISAIALSGLWAVSAQATDIRISIEIPRLEVAEYHRPYVAAWIAHEDQSVLTDLAVWYDVKMRDNEGEKWLKDMRQWWRRSGRTKTFPIDGVSGATRPPGVHQVQFSSAQLPTGKLVPGQYQLLIEAAREVGGREVLTVPFTWPVSAPAEFRVSGSEELGEVILRFVD